MPFFKYKEKSSFYQIKEAETDNAIIFIHGSGGTSNVWEYQIANLDRDYNILAIDLPSHGQSDDYPGLSLEFYVDVIKNLVKDLKLKEVILAGHSLGGAIILSYYFKYPNEVSALILIGSGARLKVSPVILTSLKTNFQEFLEGLPIGAFYRKTSKEIINKYIGETSKIAPEVIYKDFKICDEFDVIDKLNLINIPCLIICGREDRLTPPKYSQFFNEKIKNSELKIIDKASHMVMLEKPEELNRSIEDFVKNFLES